MKVAIHVGSDEWGGAEQQLARLAAGLAARGHDVRVFCNQSAHVARFRARGVAAERAQLGGDAVLPHALRFAATLRSFQPDALLVGTFKKMWLAGIAARLAGVRRVVARVGLQTDTPRNLKYRISLRWLVDAVVVNANQQAEPFVALPGWSARRVHTIYNYYDPGPPSAENVRSELGLSAEVSVVGAAGRLAAQKQLHRLLDAVAGLPDVHCILTGDGPKRAELAAQAVALEIAGRVHFLGHRDDVRPTLAALDIFVVCSDREGMSNAMLEALAAGVPVVSTPVSGAREALDPGPDGRAPGRIVDADPAALRAVLSTLLADRARLHDMRSAARARFHERFDPATILQQWEAVLTGDGT